MIFSTSYKSDGLKELLTNIVKVYQPLTVVELGVQQGSSAICLAKGLGRKGIVVGYDLFDEKYERPPHGPTHASQEIAQKNIDDAGLTEMVQIYRGNALDAHKHWGMVDILHVDLCNHYDNVRPILEKWYDKVKCCILLEGGIYNSWQKAHGFSTFNPLLSEPYIVDNYDKVIFHGDGDDALTVLTRREI